MLAEKVEPSLLGAEQAAWLQRLEDEHENLRASLESSLEEAAPGTGLRLCAALPRFWITRGHLSEGRGWCARFLAGGEDERTEERAKAVSAAGRLAIYQGDYGAARALQEESLTIRRQLGDQAAIARTLNNLGNVFYYEGDYISAQRLLEESLAIERSLGNRWGIAATLNNLGDLALLEECLAIERELGNRWGMASALNGLGNVDAAQRDYQTARARYEESLVIRRELGHLRGIAESVEGLAALVAVLGSSLRAARIFGAAERLREEIGAPMLPHNKSGYYRDVGVARAPLRDEGAFNAAWQEGRALTIENA